MRFVLRLLTLAVALLPLASSAASHTRASLLLEFEQAQPGGTFLAAVRLRMEPKWHTYWKNPGASGMATQIKWTLPEGVSAGDILWPVPEKLFDAEFTTYVLSDEALLLVPITLGTNVLPGEIKLQAEVSWLECEVACIPGDAKVERTLRVGPEARPAPDAPVIHKWRDALPKDGAFLNARATWEAPPLGNERHVLIRWQPTNSVTSLDFFPYASQEFEVLPATEELSAERGVVGIRKEIRKVDAWPQTLSGLLVQSSGGKREFFDVQVPVSEAPANAVGSVRAATASPTANQPLWLMLLYAFIGGLILNIMPCVLPVIALKILGFVGQTKDSPGRMKVLGLLYAVGVLFSFLVLAGLVIGVKAAGHKAGWGMQFSNPQFLVILTTVITLVALNLFGLFEVTPGGKVMSTAGSLASRHGGAGAFFNGVLATVLATPCTAPFLGVALGFAFAASIPVILLVFTAVALGLAFPYVLLSFNPAWLRFLPKPGAWMEKFKVAMGFPMLATAIWLFSLIPVHYGERSWWLGIFLVLVALAAWVYGEFVQRGDSRRGLAWGIIGALLIGGYALVLESQLRWRSPDKGSSNMALERTPNGVPWEAWSPEAVQKARAGGRPVLVDFTAKWCLTCNTIVKPALESAAVRQKLKEVNAAAFLGDYTLFPKNITEELNRYGRAGVPLVLVFPADPGAPPVVLPEALTPGMVVSALEKVTQLSSLK